VANLALRDELLESAEREGLGAFALRSFMSICEELGAMVEVGSALVADAGVAVACETDVHGAVSMVLLERAGSPGEPSFFADFTIRHPTNDNGVLMWHCSSPLALAHPDSEVRVGSHWILPGIPPGSCHFRLKDGPLTVARFDGERGEYRLAMGEGRSIEGPETQNTYVWMEVNDWPRWERQLVRGPYIHHTALAYGRRAAVLYEAAKYIPGLEPEPLGVEAAELERLFVEAS
jgi:L-fucose isomerase-like protein